MGRRRRRKASAPAQTIPQKSRRILLCIVIAMLVIVLRLFQLMWVEHEQHLARAGRPKERVVIEPANRGTIRDRFNIPLAVNKLSYQVGIVYAQLREVPAVKWEKNAEGKKVKVYKRREYIRSLANMLGEELDLDPERIVDLIYSKAVFFGALPFTLKENVSEKVYYKLKSASKDWPGLIARRTQRRVYPQGRVAADVVGTLGAINREELQGVMQEIALLEETLREYDSGELEEFPEGIASIADVKKRLLSLREKAYSANDYVGKSGIEAQFEERLRGTYGKHAYHADAKGNHLHDLPGAKQPVPGERLLLSISSELQEYAEELLIRTESSRETYWNQRKNYSEASSPWIRGGAIVVLDPKTGEVLTLAGYPRFDPNDFINSGDPVADRERWERIHRWYESEEYLAALWDGRTPLEREWYDEKENELIEEELPLSWDLYLNLLLAPDYPVCKVLQEKSTVADAITLQRAIAALQKTSGCSDIPALIDSLYSGPSHIPIKKERALELNVGALDRSPLDNYFAALPHNFDKVLLLDLYRLAVHAEYFSDEQVKELTLGKYRELCCSYARLLAVLEQEARPLFRETLFATWRANNEKSYLKAKRLEEKEKKQVNRPFVDYLDGVEREMFTCFWQRMRGDILQTLLFGTLVPGEGMEPFNQTFLSWHKELIAGAHQGLSWREDFFALRTAVENLPAKDAAVLLSSLRQYKELDRPLIGKYPFIRSKEGRQYEQHLASGFYPRYGYGFARSMAYRQSTVQGSVFKIVTAYEALVQSYYNKGSLELPKIFDQVRKIKGGWRVGYFANNQPIPRIYKGGRIPKSLSKNIGEIDVVKALERSSNPYFALLCADVLDAPSDLARAARDFGYGSVTGIDLPREYRGFVPEDLEEDTSGLYAMSIGQGKLVATPLQCAMMMQTIVNKGERLKPKILRLGVELGKRKPAAPLFGVEFPYDESLALVGVDFPLLSKGVDTRSKQEVHLESTETAEIVDLPEPVREKIYEGLTNVVDVVSPMRLAPMYPHWHALLDSYRAKRKQMMGKTSSGEIMEVVHQGKGGVQKITHGWFGGIVFDKKRDGADAGEPELVVIVYQRYGGAGKYAIAVASAIAEKWDEIKVKHSKSSGS